MTPSGTGAISCRPMGMEPIQFKWTPSVETDSTGSEAEAVPAGRYRIRAVDANEFSAEVVVDVAAIYERVAVVEDYVVQNASTGTSRDGRVEATGTGLDLPGIRFHWSNGVETDHPVLLDVPCGRYVVTCTAFSDDAKFFSIHQARVAVVGIRA